jgi:hypothetical protein
MFEKEAVVFEGYILYAVVFCSVKPLHKSIYLMMTI